MTVQNPPEHYHSLTVYLGMERAAEAIEFYKKAFGATEEFRLNSPDGRVGHAALRIGNSMLMLSEPCEQGMFDSPRSEGKTSFGLYLYLENADEVFGTAIEAGGIEIMPVADQFYGDRSGTLKDPFGHVWFVATHTQDLTPDEIRRRAEEMFKQG
jgi:PhnB protein